jgi:hypothetical protein
VIFFSRIADLFWFRCKKRVTVEEIELPFGARISVSFLHFLRRSTAKAHKESPGTEPRLCAEERVDYRRPGSGGARVDFSKDAEIFPTNRLAQPSPRTQPASVSKERFWVLRFEKPAHEAETTFEVCGVQLHISREAQIELKGGTLYSALDKIYAKYER